MKLWWYMKLWIKVWATVYRSQSTKFLLRNDLRGWSIFHQYLYWLTFLSAVLNASVASLVQFVVFWLACSVFLSDFTLKIYFSKHYSQISTIISAKMIRPVAEPRSAFWSGLRPIFSSHVKRPDRSLQPRRNSIFRWLSLENLLSFLDFFLGYTRHRCHSKFISIYYKRRYIFVTLILI